MSEAYNTLNIAINARLGLLTNRHSNYYEYEEYYQRFYNNSELSLSTDEIFADYDQEKFVAAINKLPLTSNSFDRLRIFFLDRSCSSAGGATFIGEKSEKNIVLYNNYHTIGDKIDALAHEIGHIVDYDIFYSYNQADDFYLTKQRDEKAMLKYTKIYGKDKYDTVYQLDNLDAWQGTFVENFAEDFANIYVGKNKILERRIQPPGQRINRE